MADESDGISEAFEGQLRVAMTAAGRVGEIIARQREEAARRAQAESTQQARELASRMQAERQSTRVELSGVYRNDWWNRATPEQIGATLATARAWRHEEPEAARAEAHMRDELRTRYGVDIDAAALAAAPGIRIDLRPLPSNPTDSERELVNHDFIAAVPGIGIAGESVELFTDHYVCMVDRANPALVDGELTWEAFRALPQAVCHFGAAHFTPADRRLRELGFARQPHLKTTGFIPLPSAIAGTDLVAVVPSRLAVRLGEATGTIGVPTPFGRVEIIETLWWHASRNSDASGWPRP